MDYTLELARQVAEDRRVRFTDRHPKTAWSRRERRTFRSLTRHQYDDGR